MVANAVRCVVHGSGLGEEFAFGFWLGHCSAPGSEADLSTMLDAWNTSNTSATTPSVWTDLANLIAADQKYDTLSAYFYADTKLPATFLHHKIVSVVGTGPGINQLQCAAVATLNTARSGASYRGRMYLPYTGRGLSTGHLFDTSSQDLLGRVAANLTGNALAAARAGALGDPTRLVVYSPTKNAINDVTSISVDTKSDVQRRRAMKQVGSRKQYSGPNP